MFFFFLVQQFVFVAFVDWLRWLYVIFGGLFLVVVVFCFVNFEKTFVGFVDLFGFLFLIVGIWWIVFVFVEYGENLIWWLGFVSGILMCILVFWIAGQFFIEKAYTLFVFAGIWVLMHGVIDIVCAFCVRMVRDLV